MSSGHSWGDLPFPGSRRGLLSARSSSHFDDSRPRGHESVAGRRHGRPQQASAKVLCNVDGFSTAVSCQERANLVKYSPVRVLDHGSALGPLRCTNYDLGSESQAQPDVWNDISQRENRRAVRCTAVRGICASDDSVLDCTESAARQKSSDEH
jgi:hypothetical protein